MRCLTYPCAEVRVEPHLIVESDGDCFDRAHDFEIRKGLQCAVKDGIAKRQDVEFALETVQNDLRALRNRKPNRHGVWIGLDGLEPIIMVRTGRRGMVVSLCAKSERRP